MLTNHLIAAIVDYRKQNAKSQIWMEACPPQPSKSSWRCPGNISILSTPRLNVRQHSESRSCTPVSRLIGVLFVLLLLCYRRSKSSLTDTITGQSSDDSFSIHMKATPYLLDPTPCRWDRLACREDAAWTENKAVAADESVLPVSVGGDDESEC